MASACRAPWSTRDAVNPTLHEKRGCLSDEPIVLVPAPILERWSEYDNRQLV